MTDMQMQLQALRLELKDVLVVHLPPGVLLSSTAFSTVRETLSKYIADRGNLCIVLPDGFSMESVHDQALEAVVAVSDALKKTGEGREAALAEAEQFIRRIVP